MKGESAMVAGGNGNTAQEKYTLAAGRSAKATDKGAFIWGDATSTIVSSVTSNEVVFQAGGSRDSGPAVELYSQSDGSAGVVLDANTGSWGSLSSAAAKTDIGPVDPPAVLNRLRDLEVSTWRYDGQPADVRHMGPMAAAFNRAFWLGTSEDRITNVDADGVALAAIQGLAEKYDDLSAANEQLRETLAEKDERIDDLEAQTEELRDRLAALETQIGADPRPADD